MLTDLILSTLFIFLVSRVDSLREECCRDAGVPEICIQYMCNPTRKLEVLWRYKSFDPRFNCQAHIAPIARCLAQGRDVTACCEEKSTDKRNKYCFGLCNGTMTDYIPLMKIPLMFCYSKNIEAVYPCLLDGYEAAPTSPQNLELVSKNVDSAEFKWEEPKEGADLVEYYSIHIVERTGQHETKKFFITEKRNLTLEGLISDFAYNVYVVAHAGEFNNNTNWYKSRCSNVVRFNIKEQLAVSKNELPMSENTITVTLYCQLRIMIEAERTIEWVKIIEDKSDVLVSEGKYSINIYEPEEQQDRNFIISALKISDFDESNFASYRCYINNTRIEYYETTVVKMDYSEQAPAESPPDSFMECCSKTVQREGCQTICTNTDKQKLALLRRDQLVGAIVPWNMRDCHEEVLSIFKCTQDDVYAAGCCIHAGIPFHCLGMCDDRFETDWKRVRQCKQYVETVYECKYETISVKPSGIGEVDVQHVWGWKFRFEWEKPADTKVFHIYYKQKDGAWDARVTLDTTVDIVSANEFVLIGVNEYGHSAPYRMQYGIDGWVPVDRW